MGKENGEPDSPESEPLTGLEISQGEECAHDPLVQMGTDTAANVYYQCQDCSTVIVEPSESPASERDRERPPSRDRSSMLYKVLQPDQNASRETSNQNELDPLVDRFQKVRTRLLRLVSRK